MNEEITEIVKKAADRIEAVEKAQGDLKAAVAKELDDLAQRFEIAPGDGLSRRKAHPLASLQSNEAIKAMAAGSARNAIIKLEDGAGLVRKSLIVGDGAGSSEEGYNVQPQRMNGLANDPRRALTLLDFLPSMRVGSNTFEFNKLSGYTSNAGYQASQGDLKPEATVPTDLVQVNIATIANWVPASEQVLADAPALSQQIQNLLGYGVRAKLERELILGAGGTGQISGLTDSGNFTAYTGAASGDTLADAVGKIEATMIAAGWRPNLIVVNPDDWRLARSERAESGAGLYVAGSWREPAPPSIWSIPVIVNPAITAGTVLVLDTTQVAVLNRQEVTVELGRVNDNFTRNIVTIRAELRAGLAVFSPGAVMFGDWEP